MINRSSLIFVFISMPLAAQVDLQQFVTDFYKKWHISHPINIEYSVKFSAKGIQTDRYAIQIPKPYIDITNQSQIDDLLAFIPQKEIRQKLRDNFKNCEIGALLYAYEANAEPAQNRYKTYFDFGKVAGNINSYEWYETPCADTLNTKNDLKRAHPESSTSSDLKAFDTHMTVEGFTPEAPRRIEGSKRDNVLCQTSHDRPRFTHRSYVSFPRYRGFLERLLSERQLAAFKAMRPMLEEGETMKKLTPDHNSLCFKFKPGIKIAEAKKYITELVRGLANKVGVIDRKKFESILASIKEYTISWLTIGPEEITVYYRKQPWVYWPELILTSTHPSAQKKS